MARAYPISQQTALENETPSRDWQALRGELVTLLDQMEGHYGRGGTAESGFAQRVRDLRYQVVESDPDNRRREALRSVKRQIDRFTDRGEIETASGETTLQSAITQIRARGPVAGRHPPPPSAPTPAPAPATHYDEMARTMTTLTHRLGGLEAELGAQRGNHEQVREIADQVGQLSRVVELLAGAVGETGQMQRLEAQIGELATLMGSGRQADLGQLTERLDQVAATVDRLADLQVQQIQHVVREAETTPQKDAETVRGIKAIETSIRSLYDRIDALESGLGAPNAELDRLTDTLGQLANRLSSEGNRPDRLLGLVDALNGRITEIEDTGYNLEGLRDDLAGLREAVLGAIEPRFSAIERQLGDLGERLNSHAADGQGIAQVEAQIRQLVARMDQTGEQLARLAGRPTAEPPDFEALASLAATRAAETISRAQTPPDLDDVAGRAATRALAEWDHPESPDFDALADRVAARTRQAIGERPRMPVAEVEEIADIIVGKTRAAIAERETPTATAADLSESSLAEIEDRISRLVDGFLRARAVDATEAADRADAASEGARQVEDRLAQLEAVLSHKAPPTSLKPVEAAAAVVPQPEEPLPPAETSALGGGRPVNDMMPRDPSVDAPLKEFGFPDLSPVRAALEARSGMAARESAAPPKTVAAQVAPPTAPAIATVAETPRSTTESDDALPPEPAGAPLFDPEIMARPPRPQSIFDREVNSAFEAPVQPAVAAADPVPPSSRNTFIEAARRSAQRQNAAAAAEVNSTIGRALARLHAGKPEKPATAPGPVTVARDDAAPKATDKAKKRGLLGRGRPKANPPKAEPAKAELPKTDSPKIDLPKADSPKAKKTEGRKTEAGKAEGRKAAAPKTAGAAPQVDPPVVVENGPSLPESFLSRHRREILVGASVVAIAFMAFNLVAQRLTAPADDAAPTLAVATAPEPVAPVATATAPHASAPVAAPGTPTAPATPAATPSLPAAAASAKPVSFSAPLASSNPASATPAATGLGPRVTASADRAVADPLTTASITPDAASPIDKTPLGNPMPPPLAPAAAATAALSPEADPAPLAVQAPLALRSPVKVDLPPDTVGPKALRQAAADGDARAQFEIGAIYSEGKVVPQDFKQASIWYERAAEQGFAPAEYRLGNLYETGKGMTKDYEQAHLWYERAANAGNRMAMHNLAALFAGGQFGKQDFASAANWFEKAANLGIRDSQFNLGMLYARGLGVPQNLETSYKWFALAASTGDSGAAKARDDIARSLDADQLKAAKAELAAFKPGQVDLAANFAPIGTWDKKFNPGPTISAKGVVLKVQEALAGLGFDVGAPDGQPGPKTAQAIKAFEQGTGMTQVGAINPRLLAVLGSQPV